MAYRQMWILAGVLVVLLLLVVAGIITSGAAA